MLLPGRKNKLIGIVLLCLFSLSAFSASGHMYLAASLAGSYANIDKTSPQVTYLSGVPIIDDYPLSGRNSSTSMLSVNGGYEYASTSTLPAIALGLGFYYNPIEYDFNGQVVETVTGAAPDILYNYTYNINSARLMAEAQFTWQIQKYLPFINVGVGPSWNNANSYMEAPVTSSGFVAQPPFQSHTTLNFAYQVGVGIGTAFNYANPGSDFLPDRIAIGYRYVNLGQTSFATRGATYPYKINTGSLTSNDVYISYIHLF